MLSVHWYS